MSQVQGNSIPSLASDPTQSPGLSVINSILSYLKMAISEMFSINIVIGQLNQSSLI
jgi:hypothetical protein